MCVTSPFRRFLPDDPCLHFFFFPSLSASVWSSIDLFIPRTVATRNRYEKSRERERKTKGTQATDPTEVSRLLHSDIRIAATVTTDIHADGQRYWNWLVRVLFFPFFFFFFATCRPAVTTKRSNCLHVHWPIIIRSFTTAWSGWIFRPSGSSSTGRLWGRFQRGHNIERSQRIRQSWIVLPTSRSVETSRKLKPFFDVCPLVPKFFTALQ